MAQLEIDAIGGDGELEGHRLMSFCHCDYYSRWSLGLRAQQEKTVRMNEVSNKTCLDVVENLKLKQINHGPSHDLIVKATAFCLLHMNLKAITGVLHFPTSKVLDDWRLSEVKCSLKL